jgi:hypothetical protein
MAKKMSQPMLPGMPRNRDLMSDEARYKRGYTPGRYKEMSDALEFTKIASDSSPGLFGKPKARAAIAKDHITRMAANSSLTPQHLNNIKAIVVFQPDEPGLLGQYRSNYDPNTKQHQPEITMYDKNIQDKSTRNSRSQTFLHEVGHHNDTFIDHYPNNDRGKAEGEAFADSFAQKHSGKTFKKGGPTGSTYLADIRKDEYNDEMERSADATPSKKIYSEDFSRTYQSRVSPDVRPEGIVKKPNKKRKYLQPQYDHEQLPLETGDRAIHRSLSD